MIEIKQTCNGCRKSRTLPVNSYDPIATVDSVARDRGWREVRENVHLCANCISAALIKN